MADDLIRYDLLVQDALRGVVRKVLTDAARDGLAGEHHFYVSFRTEAPGVRMSQRLREKYPEDMTIVLQHQFWDLGVTEHAFEVGLSFSGIPERLLIPFEALTGFFDPSVQFGLKFDLGETAGEAEEASGGQAATGRTTPRGAASEPSETRPGEARSKGTGSKGTGSKGTGPTGTGLTAIASGVPKIVPALPSAQDGASAPSGDAKASPARPAPRKPRDAGEGEAAEASAEVVSLDAFRKKS